VHKGKFKPFISFKDNYLAIIAFILVANLEDSIAVIVTNSVFASFNLMGFFKHLQLMENFGPNKVKIDLKMGSCSRIEH
jgi:hypothetical protein